jgi:hypothetical protein
MASYVGNKLTEVDAQRLVRTFEVKLQLQASTRLLVAWSARVDVPGQPVSRTGATQDEQKLGLTHTSCSLQSPSIHSYYLKTLCWNTTKLWLFLT